MSNRKSINTEKVSLFKQHGRIYCNFRVCGQRYRFSLGLDYTPENLKIAEKKASEIESDIIFNKFDGNTDKYKVGYNPALVAINPQPLVVPIKKQPNLKEIWETYRKIKGKQGRSSEDMNNWITQLLEQIEKDNPKLLDLYNSENLWLWLKDNYSDTSIFRYFASINPAINLAIANRKIDFNPYSILVKYLKHKTQKIAKCYSKDEVTTIINAFKNNEYWSSKSGGFLPEYYAGLIEFRALTATRPSEAFALTWNDIKSDNGRIWVKINKKYIKGELEKGTKNGVDIRLFPVNDQLKELLDRIPKIDNEFNLIFPSQRNKTYIDGGNFSNRYWRKIVEHGLFADNRISQYLPFYDLRHTMISHAVRSGQIDIKTLAALVGNSPDVLISRYLAVDDDVVFPNLF